MQRFEPVDPDFEARARYGFSLQNLMTTIDAVMTKVVPGEVQIELPFSTKLTQQHGYIHAGIISICIWAISGTILRIATRLLFTGRLNRGSPLPTPPQRSKTRV